MLMDKFKEGLNSLIANHKNPTAKSPVENAMVEEQPSIFKVNPFMINVNPFQAIIDRPNIDKL